MAARRSDRAESSTISPWERGATAQFDHAPRRSFEDETSHGNNHTAERHGSDSGDARADSTRRSLLFAGVGLAAAAALTVTFVVWLPAAQTSGAASLEQLALSDTNAATDTATSDVLVGAAPLGAPFTCDGPRLPGSIAQRWSAGLPGVRSVDSSLAIGERSVVAVVGTDTPDADLGSPTELIALDLDTGAVLWRAGLGFDSTDHELVGVLDGVVLIRQLSQRRDMRQVVAFDELTGEELWSTESTRTVIEGDTLVLQHSWAGPSDDGLRVEVVDPADGSELMSMTGTFVGIGNDGLVVTWAGSKVLGGFVDDERTDMLGAAEPGDSFVASVDGVFRADDTGRLVRSVRGDLPIAPALDGTGGIEAPAVVDGAVAVGDAEIVIEGNGAVYGASLELSRYSLGWRVAGSVAEVAPSDRWKLLRVVGPDDERQRVIDASTGATVAEVPVVVGWESSFSMLPNGVIMLRRDGASVERQAFDLDGELLWSLAGSGRLAVGDGVVADIDARSDPAGVGSEPTRIVLYEGEPAACSWSDPLSLSADS